MNIAKALYIFCKVYSASHLKWEALYKCNILFVKSHLDLDLVLLPF